MIKCCKRFVTFLAIVVAELALAHAAWAVPLSAIPTPVTAPEIDPRLALEGLAAVTACVVLLRERIRPRR
jgi:hypothetical protein